MAPQTVFVDLDGTLCDFVASYAEFASDYLGVSVTREDFRAWDMEVNLSISPSTHRQMWEDYWSSDRYMGIRPLPGAEDALLRWGSLGLFVHVITSRRPDVTRGTIAWMHENSLPFGNLTMISGEQKADWLRNHGYRPTDVAFTVDDHLDTVQGYVEAQYRAFLVDAPYNRAATPEYAVRVPGVGEIMYPEPGDNGITRRRG